MRQFLPLAVILLAGCQQVPHPFADDRPQPSALSLSPRDSAGIIVAPVIGAPAPIAGDLAEAMAAALRQAEVPASTVGGNKGSYRLVATAREQSLAAGRSALTVDWDLRTADGRSLGHVPATSEQSSAAWRAGGEATARAIAAPAAPAIAKLVQEEPPVAAAGVDAVVAVRPVTGAPGDGGNALTRSMAEVLRRSHVALAERPQDKETLVLAGRVEMSAPAGGKQQVKISWALSRSDGREVGQISQENAVPAGSLNSVWGDVAYAVASAAAPGVTALIERAKAADIGS